MKSIIYLSLCLTLVACSSGLGRRSYLETRLASLVVADVNLSKNSIIFGVFKDPSQGGKTVQLSYHQSLELQKILSAAHEETTITPATHRSAVLSAPLDLCIIEIANDTWYFTPPAVPHGFKLPADHLKQFEMFITRAYHTK